MPDLKAVSGVGSAADGHSRASSGGAAESLSALFDDEAQDLEVRRLLREMENDFSATGDDGEGSPAGNTLSDRWYRYQLARGAIHGEPLFDASDFAGRVSAAIDAEPALTGSSGGWRRALGSFAVAASVTVAVVLGGQQLALVTADGDAVPGRVAPLPVGVVNTSGAIPVRASFGTGALPALQPADRTAYRELARQRLRVYSQEHAEHASLNTPQGMLPFARVPQIEE